jgi:hypothetical protein
LTALFSFSVFSLPFLFLFLFLLYGKFLWRLQLDNLNLQGKDSQNLPVGLLGRVHELLLLSLLEVLLHVFLPMVLHLVVRGPFLL